MKSTKFFAKEVNGVYGIYNSESKELVNIRDTSEEAELVIKALEDNKKPIPYIAFQLHKEGYSLEFIKLASKFIKNKNSLCQMDVNMDKLVDSDLFIDTDYQLSQLKKMSECERWLNSMDYTKTITLVEMIF